MGAIDMNKEAFYASLEKVRTQMAVAIATADESVAAQYADIANAVADKVEEQRKILAKNPRKKQAK